MIIITYRRGKHVLLTLENCLKCLELKRLLNWTKYEYGRFSPYIQLEVS